MAAFTTPYGTVFYDHSGNDHWPNIRDYRPVFPKRHTEAKLQSPALKALQQAEKVYGRKIAEREGWVWKKKARAINLTGSWRSFNLQYSLWRSDNSRYASPYSSGHVQGLAIDVSTNNADFELQRQILRAVGWKQSRPDDEPWHFSWGVTV
jgi:hypothetical protein